MKNGLLTCDNKTSNIEDARNVEEIMNSETNALNWIAGNSEISIPVRFAIQTINGIENLGQVTIPSVGSHPFSSDDVYQFVTFVRSMDWKGKLSESVNLSYDWQIFLESYDEFERHIDRNNETEIESLLKKLQRKGKKMAESYIDKDKFKTKTG